MTRCGQCGAENPEHAGFCRQCGQEIEGPDPLIGQELMGRYRLVRLVGEGGMGRVYEAAQRVGTTTRKVAVKTLRPQLSADKQLARRFFREAETIVRLNHPNTIQCFDFGELADGTLAIVMEFIEGRSLAVELTRGPLTGERADRIFGQICGALAEAHTLGIVHRDLKPDNILLTERGGQADFVKVLDFGIAKISASEDDRGTKLTQQGMMVGTPPYMSPEQFNGDVVDARSDIYSLGVIAYEMLTGRLPFAARTPWEWASKHLTAEPDPLRIDQVAGVAERHARAIQRALAKSRDARPRDVNELLAEFMATGLQTAQRRFSLPTPPSTAAASATATYAQGTPAHPETLSLPTSRTGLWVVGGLVLLVGLAGGVWALNRSGQSTQPPPPPVVAGVVPGVAPLAEPPKTDAAHPGTGGTDALPSGITYREARAARRRERAVRDTPANVGASSRASAQAPEIQAPASSAPASPASRPHDASGPSAGPATPVRDLPPQAPAPTGAPPASAPVSVLQTTPPDLIQRVDRAEKAARERVEVAVGMYQAAASRYGESHPALTALRETLRTQGNMRVRELLNGNRCAQAQALFRALSAIRVAPASQGLFTSNCTAP